MKKLVKILAWVFGGLAALVLIAGIAIKVIVTKDFIASKIEGAINGRVEIRDISVPLWAAFSGISIDGFKIAEKDAEMKKPMAERSPVVKEVIGFERFEFKIAAGKLIMSLGKDFELKSLLLIKPKADVVLYEKGGNNILPLLLKPPAPETDSEKADAKSKASEKDAAAAVAAKQGKTSADDKEETSKPFSIKSAPGIIKMGKIGMEGGEFTVNIQKIQNTLTVSNVDFLLKDIYIDPAHLDQPGKNRVNLSMGLNLGLKENKKAEGAISSFLFIFSSTGAIVPFNPQTGEPTKLATVEAVFHKGSQMTGLAIFEKLKKGADQLKKIGISLDFLKDDIALNSDSKVKLEYNNGKVTFLSDLVINSEDTSIVVDEKSWVDINTYENLLTGYLKLAPKHTASIEKQVDVILKPAIDGVVRNLPAGLRAKAGESLQVETIRNNVLKPARDDQNRIMFGYKSTGKLSRPNVAIVKPEFPSAKDIVAQESRKLSADASALLKGEAEKLQKQATDAAQQAAQQAAKKEADKASKAAQEKAKQDAAAKLKKLF